jgi:cell division protein FtsN
MTQENNIYIYGEPVKPKRVVEQTSSTNSSGLVIEVPVPPPAVAVPSSAPTGRALPRDTPGVSAPAPTSAPKKTAPPASQPVRQPPVSKTPAPVPQPQRVDYWVQAGSFSELNRAKSAQETLAAKGITAIIETKDVQGKNFHRVRVGPYTSQKEADYWLSVMKKLAGFEESLILQSAAPR